MSVDKKKSVLIEIHVKVGEEKPESIPATVALEDADHKAWSIIRGGWAQSVVEDGKIVKVIYYPSHTIMKVVVCGDVSKIRYIS